MDDNLLHNIQIKENNHIIWLIDKTKRFELLAIFVNIKAMLLLCHTHMYEGVELLTYWYFSHAILHCIALSTSAHIFSISLFSSGTCCIQQPDE